MQNLHFSPSQLQVPYKKQLEGLHMACLGVYRTILISPVSTEALSECELTKETNTH